VITINQTKEQNEPQAIASYKSLLLTEYGQAWLDQGHAEAQEIASLADPRRSLHIGMAAPNFILPDIKNLPVSLASLRTEGPVVVLFYRGGWCPFCNVQLRAFQLAKSRIRAYGAQIVLISPQQIQYSQALAEQQTILIPVLSDVGNRVARQYGLTFHLPPSVTEEYRLSGIDLAEINGDPSGEIPMPATFVVDKAGMIQYAHVSANYTERAEPADVLAVLRRMHK
jgi:peroxiredoxin